MAFSFEILEERPVVAEVLNCYPVEDETEVFVHQKVASLENSTDGEVEKQIRCKQVSNTKLFAFCCTYL